MGGGDFHRHVRPAELHWMHMPRALNFDDPSDSFDRLFRRQNRDIGSTFRDVQFDSDRSSVSDLDETELHDTGYHSPPEDSLTLDRNGDLLNVEDRAPANPLWFEASEYADGPDAE